MSAGHRTYLTHEGVSEEDIAGPGIDSEEFGAIKKEGWFNAVSYVVPLLVPGADGNYTRAYTPKRGTRTRRERS